MRYHLAERCVLRWIEKPCVYDSATDELYELDERAFAFLRECATEGGCPAEGADGDFLDYCLSESILTLEADMRKAPPLVRAPVPSLRYLELLITDRCNLKCRHCYAGPAGRKELTVGQIRDVLEQFEEMQGLRLLVSGGEPLVHRRFDEVNGLLEGFFFRKVLFTNGLLLGKERLADLNVDELQFSIDGLEGGHDTLRGAGTFRKVLRTVEDALASGMDVSVATMIHRENLSEFEGMETLFRGLGIRDWTVDVPCPTGNLRDNQLLEVPPDVAGRYLRYGYGGGLHGGGEGYACGLHLVSVLPDGKVAKCAFFRQNPVGSLIEGLRTCWARVRPLPLSALGCAGLSCGFIDLCRGGCRYRASLTARDEGTRTGAGEGMAPDLYKCFEYGRISEA